MSYTLNRLRTLREERELKQTTVAEEIGISRAMLSNYESGKMPSLWNAIKLAQFYHVSLDYIFGLTAEKNSGAGSLLSSFATLSGLMGDAAPTASDVAALVEAAIMYQCSGAPCGEQVVVAWRDFMRQLTQCFGAAAKGDTAQLIDRSNAATVSALEVARMPANFDKGKLRDAT